MTNVFLPNHFPVFPGFMLCQIILPDPYNPTAALEVINKTSTTLPIIVNLQYMKGKHLILIHQSDSPSPIPENYMLDFRSMEQVYL